MQDKFPARVRRSGGSWVITIPESIRDKYEIGETVNVTIEKTTK